LNTFDLIVFAVIIVSGLLAFVRGFVREVLAIGAWVGAVFATVYLTQPTQPLFRQIISAAWLADIVGPIVIFVLALLALSLITGTISSRVRDSGLGSVDRALGLAFGVVRGVVILCVACIVLNYIVPPASRPGWIAEARSLPLLEQGAASLEHLLPRDLINRSASSLEAATQKAEAVQQIQDGLATLNAAPATPDQQPQPGTAPAPGQQPAKPAAPSYSATDQNGLNQLFKGAQ
jgi:membrane protein required for colicin V production